MFIVLGSIVLFFILSFSVLTAALYAHDNGKICRGVYVDGINFSYADKSDFEKRMQELEKSNAKANIIYTYQKHSEKVLLSNLNYKLNVKNTYEHAFKIGRDGNFLSDFGFKIVSFFGKKTNIDSSISLNKAKYEDAIKQLVLSQDGKTVEHAITIEPDRVVIKPGKSGLAPAGNYYQDTLKSIHDRNFHVNVSLKIKKPHDIDVEKLKKDVDKPAKDAAYQISGKDISIASEETGRDLDTSVASNKLKSLKEGGPDVVIEVTVLKPKVTLSQLSSVLFKDTLATYSSWYNRGLAARSQNVELAVRYMNGTIIAPGGEFSYNKAVGPRTLERGFASAQIYVNNEIEDGLGGGICQVSSTLYNTVLLADLTVIERKNHSLPITYVPLGQDATVSYGSVDFRFKNNKDYPIKIIASCSNGYVHVSLLGYQDNPNKKIVIRTDTKQVLSYSVDKTNDSSLPSGKTRIVQRGKNGCIVDTYKQTYLDGKLVSEKYLHRSKYSPENQKIIVGTGKSAQSSASQDSPVSDSSPPASSAPTTTDTPAASSTPTDTTSNQTTAPSDTASPSNQEIPNP